MANIAIVNYCNLKCKYCFADDMIQEESKSITIEDFNKILEFISRTPDNAVGIIGGEPTLHPKFQEILSITNKYCNTFNTRSTLFTNGIEVEKFMPYIGERIGLLVNINSPESQGDVFTDKQMQTLDHFYELSWLDTGMGGKAGCGCNIHYDCKDYKFIWDIVDRYHIRSLRTSVVSPGATYAKYRNDKELYYSLMKPIFLQYCEDAIRHNCRLNMDCGHIPMCYFNQEEKALVERICVNLYQDWCDPVIDINPNFKATACFGSYEPVDIRDFNNIHEVRRFLQLKKSLPKAQANCGGKCSKCKKFELMQCQGGCLAFGEGGR